ncbi:Rnf-Nqr domain containing protein [Pseudomonas purpurea]|uniref:Rnf-Nqr domain containing protein n=1 Tax=Pseudomonas purpurea TaxID=3136737 RepID=UPI0032678A55
MNRSSALQHSLVLAPLIGASDSLGKAVTLWLMSVLVISLYGLKMSVLRPRMVPGLLLITSLLLAALLTGLAALALQAWAYELHKALGIYVGLIALQCVVLEHNGFFQQPRRLRLAGLFGALMLSLGLLREVIGNASLGHDFIPALLGNGGLFSADGGLHMATLAPGGFILLGLLIAAKQAWTGASQSH